MRSISTSFRNSLEDRHNPELILVFATISHPNLYEPIRVVCEDVEGVSYNANGIINYKWNGDLYYGCPFSFSLLTDDEQPPRSKLTIHNVDRKIGQAILAIDSSPRFRFSILKSSDFGSSYDSDNARTPTGTPEIEYDADYLYLRDVSGDQSVITADIVTFDIENEPCPALRATQDVTPCLYR